MMCSNIAIYTSIDTKLALWRGIPGWINTVAAAIKKAENTSLRGKFYSITKKMHMYWNQNIAQIPFITLQDLYNT
jgi:hypothetical protein